MRFGRLEILEIEPRICEWVSSGGTSSKIFSGSIAIYGIAGKSGRVHHGAWNCFYLPFLPIC
jgi:hypothetical protein